MCSPALRPTQSPVQPARPADNTIAIIIACTVTVSALAIIGALLALYIVRRRRLHGGGVDAPGASPLTTLLLTDIQNSTLLWETLPAEVMDAAIGCHHKVFRSLMAAHNAYESATEG